MQKILLYLFINLFIAAKGMSQVTSLIQNENPYFLGLLNNNKAIFYSDVNKYLWVTDGTPSGTKELTKKVRLTDETTARVLNGKLLFNGVDATNGNELWITDGTDAGTILLKDINPGTAGSGISDRMVLLNNKIYFSAFTAANGREMWVSDGTETGTRLIRDIAPGAASSNTERLYKVAKAGDLIYFVCNLPASGEELWRSDGTDAGTFMVKDIFTGAGSSVPNIQGTLGNKILFVAYDDVNGREPWISDGTTNGTFMLRNIYPGNISSSADHFIELNGKAIFAANDDLHGQELFETDGTTAGTKLLKDIMPGSIGSMPELIDAVEINGKLIFRAWNEEYGYELWETNGTNAGTKLFKDVAAGMEDSYPILLPAYGNGYQQINENGLFQGSKFFFTSTTNAHGAELYVSDGTPAGTRMVKDLYPGPEYGFNSAYSYYISRTAIYFSGTDATGATALYASDGTEAGTRKIAAVRNDGQYAVENPFIIVNNFLLFTADDGNSNSGYFDLYRVNANDVVLPVSLSLFKGFKSNGFNQLEWKVESAVNFKHFQIEKSNDGASFSPVGIVNYTNGKSSYQFRDADLAVNNETFYRLRLVDLDGNFSYSSIVKIGNNTLPGIVKMYQQAPGNITIQYRVQPNVSTLLLFNSNGQLLRMNNVSGSVGTINIPLPNTAKGIVHVQLLAGNQKYLQSLLIRH